MLIDFWQVQQKKFEQIIAQVQADPQQYLDFESVADVYQAQWIKNLPACCQWYVSGLDDGGADFVVSICCGDQKVLLEPYSQIHGK